MILSFTFDSDSDIQIYSAIFPIDVLARFSLCITRYHVSQSA